MQTSYNTPEIGGPLSVCVEMFNGNLERNVSLTLTTSDITAIGMTSRHTQGVHSYHMVIQHTHVLHTKKRDHILSFYDGTIIHADVKYKV